MSEDIDENTNEFHRADKIQVPLTVAAGAYSIALKAYYDTDKLADSKTVSLAVEDCPQLANITEGTATPLTIMVRKPYPLKRDLGLGLGELLLLLLALLFALLMIFAAAIIASEKRRIIGKNLN